MVIYPKAFPGGAYTLKGPDDTVYAKSETGWVDSELFLSLMNKYSWNLQFHSIQSFCSLMATKVTPNLS